MLESIGGGIEFITEVKNVPKGSGLGTSSILAAACVKALLDFVGNKYTDHDIYLYVLCMEQIMSTGGGWQDQVGGLTNGIKLISSKPGLRQDINVEYLELDKNVKEELNARFALIYTGKQRLAKNLLRDVVDNYLSNKVETVSALSTIQDYAKRMAEELSNGNIDEFAKLLNMHWKQSKIIDYGSSNENIENIFESISDLIDGRMICGAGGGGFLQVILKKDVSKDELNSRLENKYPNSEIRLWNCSLV